MRARRPDFVGLLPGDGEVNMSTSSGVQARMIDRSRLVNGHVPDPIGAEPHGSALAHGYVRRLLKAIGDGDG